MAVFIEEEMSELSHITNNALSSQTAPKHSSESRMLCEILPAGSLAAANAADDTEQELHLRLRQSRGWVRNSLFLRRR